MWLKKFSIYIIKSLIVLLLTTLIFSTVTLNFPNIIKDFFGDIFLYASPQVQNQTIEKLAETCSSLDNGGALTVGQICSNASLLESMRLKCQAYREMKIRNLPVENEENVRQTCSLLESGQIQNRCGKSSFGPDIGQVGAACSNYKSGKVDDKEFFFEVVSSSIPGSLQLPQNNFYSKYNQAIGYLNGNKIAYFAVLALLIFGLYMLIRNSQEFAFALMAVSFNIGLLIMLPYFSIIAYEKIIGFDTTPILSSLFGAGNVFDIKSISSLFLLLFLKTYNSFIVILGAVFLGIGVTGKIYARRLKKEKANEQKNDNKNKDTKELLDELESEQKKKNKD